MLGHRGGARSIPFRLKSGWWRYSRALSERRPEVGHRVVLRWNAPGFEDGTDSHVCVYTWHQRWVDAMASNVPGAALPTHWMAIPEVPR